MANQPEEPKKPEAPDAYERAERRNTILKWSAGGLAAVALLAWCTRDKSICPGDSIRDGDVCRYSDGSTTQPYIEYDYDYGG